MTVFVPKPGTRSSISRSARFTSTGKRCRFASAQASLGSTSRSSIPSRRGRRQFVEAEAVEPQQPVRLVEPMLAHQRRTDQRQRGRAVGDGRERGVVDALQPVGRVEPRRLPEDRRVRSRRRRRRSSASTGLPARSGAAACRGGSAPCRASLCRRTSAIALRIVAGFFSGAWARTEASVGSSTLIDRRSACSPACSISRRVGVGDGLEVDVALEAVLLAQLARDLDHLPHRVVGRADDAGRQEQPLDVVPPVEFQRQRHDLVDAEPRPLDVRADAVHAVGAVVDAEVRHQDLEQADAAPVGRVGVADARAFGRADAALAAVAARRCRTTRRRRRTWRRRRGSRASARVCGGPSVLLTFRTLTAATCCDNRSGRGLHARTR